MHAGQAKKCICAYFGFLLKLIRFSNERLQKLIHEEITDVGCTVGAVNVTRWKARVTGQRAEAVHRRMGQLSCAFCAKANARWGAEKSFDLSQSAIRKEAGRRELFVRWRVSGSDVDWCAAIAGKPCSHKGLTWLRGWVYWPFREHARFHRGLTQRVAVF